MTYGYARVSTRKQTLGNGLDVQERELRESGAEVIYSEMFTGTKRHRPELDKLLSVLREGDKVVVAKLDRVARSTKEGLAIIDEILSKGCSIEILNMGKFDNTPSGKMLRTIMFAFAEFERDMIVERTTAGKEIARQRPDYQEGRKRADVDIEPYIERVNRGEISVNQACRELGIGKSSWYTRYREYVA